MTPVVKRASVSSALAQRMVQAACARGRALGKAFTVAVVDESGVLKSFARMDGAPLISVQVAQDKAYTAAGFKLPTDMWYDFIKGDPPLLAGAPAGIDRLVVFGGGYPVTIDGKVVGGIGVSGGHWSEDMVVAQAGLAQIADNESVARRLARYLTHTLVEEPPTPAARHHAKRAIVNALAASLAATKEPAAKVLVDWEKSMKPPGGPVHPLWSSLTTSVDHAALINGTLLHLLDFDDTHISTVVHATAPVLAALLAESQVRQVDGLHFLDAFIAGVEVEIAVAAMLMPSHYRRGFHVTAIAGTVGATVGVGVLQRLSVDQMVNAIGIATNSSAGLKENFGSMTKALGVGNAARGGLVAAYLARAGATAAETVFEGSSGLVAATSNVNAERAHAGLSILGARSLVADLALKRYPTGVAMHAPLDAVLALRNRVSAEMISHVDELIFCVDPLVEEHWRVATGLQRDGRKLLDPLEAKFSFKYCMAHAWLFGRFDLESMNERGYADHRVVELMKRVSIVADQTVTMTGCRARVVFSNGTTAEHVVVHHRGSPANRLSDEEISEKFLAISRNSGLFDDRESNALLSALWELDNVRDMADICRRLANPT